MKKRLIILPLVAFLTFGTLTACVPDPTVGSGIPVQIQSIESVVSISVVQPDALGGTDGVQYAVVLEDKLNSSQLAAKANEITEELIKNTKPSDNWGVRFRSGQREIGMSQSAYILDHPEYAPTPTPTPGVTETPTPSPTPEPTLGAEATPIKDSYALQLVAINDIFKTDETLFVKTYDALVGYVEVYFSDQTRLEEFFTNTGAALDLAEWKHRGDFRVNLIIANESESGILVPTGVAVLNEINVTMTQNEGLSKLLVLPETAIAMYRAIPTDVKLAKVAIRSRGLHEEIFVTYSGRLDQAVNSSLSSAFYSIQTEDTKYVKKEINPEY